MIEEYVDLKSGTVVSARIVEVEDLTGETPEMLAEKAKAADNVGNTDRINPPQAAPL